MIVHGRNTHSDLMYLRENYDELYVLHYDNVHINANFNFHVEKDIYFFRRK